MNYTIRLFLCAILFATHLFSVPPKSVTNKFNPVQTLSLKWKKRVGLTTYRSPILYHNQYVVFGSNGSKRNSFDDTFDGLYAINGTSGKNEFHLLPKIKGDRDVTGVALSNSRIYFGDDENRLFSINWEGKMHWVTTLGGDIEDSPALEDINSDGILDVLVGDESGSFYAVDGESGRVLWRFQATYKPHFTYPESKAFFSSASLIDLTNDGVKDCIVGNRNGDVYAFDSKTGSVIWEFRTDHPSGIYSSPFIRHNKIYIAETYATLYVLSLKGKRLRSISRKNATPPELFSSPVVDQYETISIGVSSKQGQGGVWFVFKDESQRFHPVGNVSSTPLLADLLNLGYEQFIVLTEKGELLCFDPNGNSVGSFQFNTTSECTPLLTDCDNDGYLELIITTEDQFIACYDTASKGPVEWGSFRGNPFNTGVYDDPITLPSPYDSVEAGQVLSGIHYINPIDITKLGKAFFIISEEGIGPVKIGTTFGKMKLTLGRYFEYKDINLTLGLKAKAVMLNDTPLFYVIYPAFKEFTDQSTITILGTDNPSFVTEDGLNAMTPVSELAKRFGKPTFSYHAKNSLEEFVLFQNKPKWLWLANYGQDKIGIYDTEQDFNTTQVYDPDKTVKFIGVKN